MHGWQATFQCIGKPAIVQVGECHVAEEARRELHSESAAADGCHAACHQVSRPGQLAASPGGAHFPQAQVHVLLLPLHLQPRSTSSFPASRLVEHTFRLLTHDLIGMRCSISSSRPMYNDNAGGTGWQPPPLFPLNVLHVAKQLLM